MALTSWEGFLSHYRRIRSQHYNRSVSSRKTIWQEVYWYYCREPSPGLVDDLQRRYWETVKARTQPFPESEHVLELLASKYKMGLITNTQGQGTGSRHRLYEYPQLMKFFKAIIIAGESDVPPKPAPEPFIICLKELGVQPREAVYVGDDWRIDVCGARDAGLKPVWFKHHLVARNWPALEADVPTITRLNELLDIDALLA